VAVTRHAPPVREVSDGAILEIYTLEALRGRLLVGPYSRFGWHHPGPLYFYLLAPWYWLSGFRTAGMQAGALAINLGATWLIVRTLISAATTPTAIVVSGFTAWYAFRTGDMLVSAWNPHIVVLPLIAYIVLAAAMAARPGRSYLLGLVAVGAFLAQTHLAMVPIVAVLGITAAWNGRGLSNTTWVIAVVLKLLLWIPPLTEQLTHRPGNLLSIVRFFVNGGGGQRFTTAVASWASALTAAFRQGFLLALGEDYVPVTGWFLPVLAASIVAMLVALAMKTRRTSRFDSWLLAMCAIASVVALFATTRIQDRIIDHEVFWMSGVGALSVAACLGGVMAIAIRTPRAFSIGIVETAGVLAWAMVAFVGIVGMTHVLGRRRTLDDHAVDVLTDQLQSYRGSAGVRKPLFEIEPPVWPIAAGALLQIDKTGARFAVGARWAPMFGDRFVPTGLEDGTATIAGSAVSTSVTPSR
jgi:hypothetical protein